MYKYCILILLHFLVLSSFFICRLLSWGGKQIEPVGVDYILQKLGFKHARVTIPKWMQRGAMDPVDQVIAFIVHRLIRVLKDEESK